MDSDSLIHVGLGGTVAILILRETFNFLKSSKKLPNGQRITIAGNQSTEFWQTEIRRAVTDSISPFLNNQTEILKLIAETNRDINRGIIELVTLSRRREG